MTSWILHSCFSIRWTSPVLNLYFSFSARREWKPIRIFFYMLEEFFDVWNSWVVEFTRTWWKCLRECFVLSMLTRWLLVSIYKTTGAVPTQFKLFCSLKVFWISVEEYDKKVTKLNNYFTTISLLYTIYTNILQQAVYKIYICTSLSKVHSSWDLKYFKAL